MKKASNRKEKDSLGEVEVPANCYYGAQTTRARENFKISGLKAPEIFQIALGIVKLAAIRTNHSLKEIEEKYAKVIEQACQEFIDGNFTSDFILDVFQAGAGTSYNMNANEIIANRANELLKAPKGSYKFVDPNDHVNMAQSTNDVIPTATKIAVLLILPTLIKELEEMAKALNTKSRETAKIIKVGRTHLQDAVPISMGQEFDAYKEAIQEAAKFIKEIGTKLTVLGIGGTAVGTGINTHPKYKTTIVKELSKITKIPLKSAKNLTEAANNYTPFLNFSASLRSLAVTLLNIGNDLKIMNMGPKAGINEIDLPAIQPGSSIMPGKVNPSVIECIEMICAQVIGNDKVVEISAAKSQFELNTMCPIIMYNLIQSVTILANGLRTLRTKGIEGMKINKEKIQKTFEESLCTATALSPKLGYKRTAELVKTALKNSTNIREEVLKAKLLSNKELDAIFSQA